MNASLVIFDGDNTLWDTNEVFANAQRRMLEGLRSAGFAADPDRDFLLLRRIDDRLIGYFGGFRYEPKYLAYALIRHSQVGEDAVSDAAIEELDGEPDEVKRVTADLGERLKADVQEVPRLLPGAMEAVNAIRQKGPYVVGLYSDASPRRLDAISSYYDLSAVFDLVEQGDKSDEGWRRVLELGREKVRARFGDGVCRVYVIGDLLRSDIRPANRLGAVTIYKPGGYRGAETPQDAEECPTFTVHTPAEVVAIV